MKFGGLAASRMYIQLEQRNTLPRQPRPLTQRELQSIERTMARRDQYIMEIREMGQHADKLRKKIINLEKTLNRRKPHQNHQKRNQFGGNVLGGMRNRQPKRDPEYYYTSPETPAERHQRIETARLIREQMAEENLHSRKLNKLNALRNIYSHPHHKVSRKKRNN